MKRLVAKVGEYQNKQGETKGKYVTIGVIRQGQNGEYAFIDPTVNLAGVLVKQRLFNPQKAGENVMCSIYDDSQQNNQQSQQGNNNQQSGDGGFNDDIPFAPVDGRFV